VDATASHAARLGAEIRAWRERRELTLEALARLIEFSPGHISAVERAQAPVSEQFVASCDEALKAGGALLALLPSVIYERAADRHRNQARRRERARSVEIGDAITAEPQASRGRAPLVIHAGPVTTRSIRWQRLLDVFIASERVLGARPVITAMAAELPILRAEREAARAEARTDLLRAESPSS